MRAISSKILLVAAAILSIDATNVWAECDPTKILRDNVTSYQRDIETWLAYVDSLSKGGSSSSNPSLGVGYAGFDLSFSDAQAASNYYQSSTSYQLAQSDRISILSTQLSPDSVTAYVACLTNATSNMTISAPDGSSIQQGFPITVSWHPTYKVSVVHNSTDRDVRIDVSNGKLLSKNDAVIAEKGQVTFKVLRESLDLPITIVATIDEKVSDFFTFPPKPKFKLELTQREDDIGPIRRSGHYGDTPVSLPLCIKASPGGRLLVGSAVTTVTGAGAEWKERSNISLDKGANPLEICATVYSAGVGCDEEKCYHETTGHLRVLEMAVKKIGEL
jgi:hypothetical protein